jgi:hypothetical protein
MRTTGSLADAQSTADASHDTDMRFMTSALKNKSVCIDNRRFSDRTNHGLELMLRMSATLAGSVGVGKRYKTHCEN